MNKVIIIMGPTCVGKTGVSILLAKALKTEIISADSMQVYRHMDIGTAKPSIRELSEVKHHLINILSPQESFSAGEFKRRAVEVIDDLHGQERIPVIVGGTGLYIRSITRGLFEAPAADWSLRERLMQMEREKGRGYLHGYLQRLDPAASERIEPNDLRRIIRAIEVSLKTKERITELQRIQTAPLPYDFIKIGLTRQRRELYRLIEDRVERMIQDGLIEETERLLRMNPHRIPLQALGYKEMALYLNGTVSLDEAKRLLKRRTKMYAKRQFTWFKKEPGVHWVDVTGLMAPEDIFSKVVKEVEILRRIIYPQG
jgi:tRNA dimethylallyltransferase